MMGFITCMNDILIPHLQKIFTLTNVQAMLIQFCFFTAYAIMSIPMGHLVGKIGYKNGVIGGFLLTAVGCLLFYPAAGSHSYPTFLGALFILASGVTLLQVSGNPYVTLLAKPGKESATLTLVQAFNSFGVRLLLRKSVHFSFLQMRLRKPAKPSKLLPSNPYWVWQDC